MSLPIMPGLVPGISLGAGAALKRMAGTGPAMTEVRRAKQAQYPDRSHTNFETGTLICKRNRFNGEGGLEICIA